MKVISSFPNWLFGSLIFLASTVLGQPKITSFSPAKGAPGSTVVITGTGFDAVPASNLVYFGAVAASVTSASPASLAVTVPAGASYKPISVLNTTTHLTAYSALPFSPTFTQPFGANIPNNYYNLPVTVGATGASFYFDIADLDGDGKPDLVASSPSSTITVLRNTAAAGEVNTASFAPRVDIAPGNYPGGIAVSDVDGDGKLDLVYTDSYFSNTVSILRNISTPGSITASSFAPRVSFVTAHSPTRVIVGDVDGDGRPDLIVNNSDGDVISVLRNTSTPGSITASSFAARVDIISGASSRSFVFADVDGDGKSDLVSSLNSSAVSILLNAAVPGEINKASFKPYVAIPIAYDPSRIPPFSNNPISSVRIADIDDDGKPDLITSDTYKSSILRNVATPGSITAASFQPQADYAYGIGRSIPLLSDADGDGKLDFVGTDNTLKNIYVSRNVSSPGSITSSSFADRISFYSYNAVTQSINTGDIDGDGLAEIILANQDDNSPGAGNVSVLKINLSNSVLSSPLRIASFSPVTGPAGTQVTITGTNFNIIPARNSVYFGAVKATVTGGSTNSLTVTVPAGAVSQPVSVTDEVAGLVAISSLPFITTFNNPYGAGNMPPGFYKPKIDFASSVLPYCVVLSDLNGDGRLDMITANENANTVSVIKNTAAGSISPSSFDGKVDYPVGASPRSIALGDLDGNGTPDIVVANSRSGTVSVLPNHLTPDVPVNEYAFNATNFPAGDNPYSVAIGDIDGDGKPELVAANLSSGTVSVLRNTSPRGYLSSSSFAFPVAFQAGLSPRFVALNDVDGDGKADLVVVNERSNTVTVLRNTAVVGTIDAGSFAPGGSFATGNSPAGLLISDVDGDGKKDLVVCNYGSSSVSVLRNTAVAGTVNAASFAAKADYATGAQPFFVTTAQVDGDGRLDLVTANSSSNSVSVLRNTAVAGVINGASFAPKADYATGGYPVSVAVGDLDNDGISELVSADAATNSVAVLSFSLLQPPVISSVSPASGPAGSTVSVAGINFNTTPSNNIVYFGAVKATVTASTVTSLLVTVPAGATYQPLSVLNTGVGLTGYSAQPFINTFVNPFGTGIGAGFYRPRTDFAAGALPFYTAIGDMDGDGKPDLVVANTNAGTVSVLRNTSATGALDAASFASKTDFATAADPRSLVLSDVDGDGRLDIAVACASSYTISVLRNTATAGSINAASFAGRVDLPNSVYVSAIAAADLDRDGKPDLVVTNLYSNSIYVLRNVSVTGSISTASFAPKLAFATGAYPRSLALSDIDGDGRQDIVVANEQSNNVSVLRNLSVTGALDLNSFAPAINFAAGARPPSVAAGDVDGDGRPDLVVAGYGSNTVSVLRNTANPGSINAASFAARVDYATASNPFYVALGDADGDGKADIAVANANSNINQVTNTVSVLRNTASAGSITAASFAGRTDFAAGGYPDCIAVGDLDGDGVSELVAANAATGVSVFKIAAPQQVAAAPAGEGRIQVYPNPTSGAFVVELQGMSASSGASVELVSESGKVIEKKKVAGGKTGGHYTLQLSLRNQPAGVYYVKVTSVDGVQVAKLVIQQ